MSRQSDDRTSTVAFVNIQFDRLNSLIGAIKAGENIGAKVRVLV